MLAGLEWVFCGSPLSIFQAREVPRAQAAGRLQAPSALPRSGVDGLGSTDWDGWLCCLLLLPDDSGLCIHSSLCSEFGKCSEHSRLGFDIHQISQKGRGELGLHDDPNCRAPSDQVHRLHSLANRAVPQPGLASSLTCCPASLTDDILHHTNSLTATPPALSAPLSTHLCRTCMAGAAARVGFAFPSTLLGNGWWYHGTHYQALESIADPKCRHLFLWLPGPAS